MLYIICILYVYSICKLCILYIYLHTRHSYMCTKFTDKSDCAIALLIWTYVVYEYVIKSFVNMCWIILTSIKCDIYSNSHIHKNHLYVQPIYSMSIYEIVSFSSSFPKSFVYVCPSYVHVVDVCKSHVCSLTSGQFLCEGAEEEECVASYLERGHLARWWLPQSCHELGVHVLQ